MLSFERKTNAFTSVTPRAWDSLHSINNTTGNSKGKGRADGPPRIVIEDLRSSRPPQNYKEESLKRLVDVAVRSVLDRHEATPLPASYRDIAKACEILVNVYGKAPDLCELLRLQLEMCTTGISSALSDDPSKGAGWLVQLKQQWTFFEQATRTLKGLLAHLDRGYILERPDIDSIQEQAWKLFRKNVLLRANISYRVEAGVIDWIDSERKNGRASEIVGSSVATLVDALTTLGIYTEPFERPLLERTQVAYSNEGNELAKQLKPSEYLEHWRMRCAQESSRASTHASSSSVNSMSAVLPKGTCNAVVQAAERAFLAPHAEWLAKEGLREALNSNDISRVASLYTLLSGVGEVDQLRKSWVSNLEARTRAIISAQETDGMVEKLLQLKELAEKLLVEAFEEGQDPKDDDDTKKSNMDTTRARAIRRGPFSQGLDDAFAAGFVAGGKKPAEMIAKFIDKKMQEGQRNASDAAFMQLLNDVLTLFRYTPDKDVFRAFYTRALARRLLRSRSASDDFERAVIKKQREEHDPEFGKGDEMFKDLQLSRDFTADFHRKHPDDRGLNVSILQVSSWPFSRHENSKGFPLDLPPSMVDSLNRFSRYYTARQQNRKLEWAHELGTASVTARFPKGTKELSVSLVQAAVLLLFNNQTELRVQEIASQTQIEDAELRRTLQSLALGKHRVLVETPAGREVKDDDVFIVNEDFSDPRAKIQIRTIQAPSIAAAEDLKTNEQIESECGFTLDAAIVRIMEGKKKMAHQQLVTSTIEAVAKHFVPSVDMIKKRIERLIVDEYMKRSDGSRNVYEYMA